MGTCSISSERGPGIRQTDISLSKTFAITDIRPWSFAATPSNSFNTPIFAVNGYATDVCPGGAINKALYGSNPTYTAGIPTGVIHTSVGARNPQFALKYQF